MHTWPERVCVCVGGRRDIKWMELQRCDWSSASQCSQCFSPFIISNDAEPFLRPGRQTAIALMESSTLHIWCTSPRASWEIRADSICSVFYLKPSERPKACSQIVLMTFVWSGSVTDIENTQRNTQTHTNSIKTTTHLYKGPKVNVAPTCGLRFVSLSMNLLIIFSITDYLQPVKH